MATTMNLIAKQTVGSGGAASVTFSNIPQTFTDLKLVVSARTTRTGTDLQDELFIQFNGNTSSYTTMMLEGNGSATRSATYSAQTKLLYGAAPTDNSTANTFSNCEYYIPNYTSSNNKSVSYESTAENNATGTLQYLTAGLWGNSAAITSITITAYGTFDQYTTAYLYGISNSSTQNTSVPLASGGDVITTDGTYWYHAFKSSGSFVPQKNLTADVLVVAGGGGGSGAYEGAGGGAGGIQYLAAASLTSATAYSCTIGAGGAGNNINGAGANGANGGNSLFSSTITAIGGGGAGSYNSYGNGNDANSGGSGGGGSRAAAVGSATAGTGGTFYGNAGGAGSGSGGFGGGGGGGAGAVGGAAPNSTTGGNGGNGLSTWSSWGSATTTGQNVSGTYYYAGGGGGGTSTPGTGGYGGGGAGANSANATNGTANTGGGGGGTSSASPNYGGTGGSGIIIVRYAVA